MSGKIIGVYADGFTEIGTMKQSMRHGKVTFTRSDGHDLNLNFSLGKEVKEGDFTK